MSTLADIRLKVRRVTKLASANKITDQEIDDYVNTFYLYDFPEHLRLINLKETFTLVTQPNIDIYNFTPNTIVSIEPPVYMGGMEIIYFQDREQYFTLYPEIQQNEVLSTGNGTAGPYAGTITGVPIKRNRVLISTVDVNGNAQSAQDNGLGFFVLDNAAITGITQAASAIVTAPNHSISVGDIVHIRNVFGMTEINGGPYTVSATTVTTITLAVNSTNFAAYRNGGTIQTQEGTVNYTTGAIAALNFSANIAAGENIRIQSVNYQSARPQAVLFYNDIFQLSPVPDQAYEMVINAFVTPTSLINAIDEPQLREWWQLLAIGASRKIFGDLLDMESFAKVDILFEEQKRLVERRTIKQLSNQRAATIYQDQYNFGTPFRSNQ